MQIGHNSSLSEGAAGFGDIKLVRGISSSSEESKLIKLVETAQLIVGHIDPKVISELRIYRFYQIEKILPKPMYQDAFSKHI